MREPKGWYQDAPQEWRNNDYAYSLSVEEGDLIGYYDRQAYIAYLWIEHPGVRYLRNGDPGSPPDWEEFDLGTFDTLDEAQQAAEVAVSEWEARDAAMYAEMEMIAAKGGWDD
jgi:hypothetical protein